MKLNNIIKFVTGIIAAAFLLRFALFAIEQGTTWLLRFFILGEIPGTQIQITFRALMLATAVGLSVYLVRRFDQEQAKLQ